jgi:hypothetical protein
MPPPQEMGPRSPTQRTEFGDCLYPRPGVSSGGQRLASLGCTGLVREQLGEIVGDGHLRITGTLKVTMTNVRTGQHIGINSSGPVTLWPQTGGGIIAVGRGIGFIALSIEPEEPGQPGGFLLQTKGQTVSDGIDLHLVHGTSRDICPMIS